MIEIKEYNNKSFFFIKYNEYKPSNTEDSKNEYLTKLFKANIKIIEGKIIFKLFFEILLKFNNITKIIRDAIEYNNWGFGELTKN